MCSFVQSEGRCENQEKGQGLQVQEILFLLYFGGGVVRTEKSIHSGCFKVVHALFKATIFYLELLKKPTPLEREGNRGEWKERVQWDSFFIFIFI